VPKAKPFSEGDEEEKTTIESQWEDEASTTVEEGDVAERIRALGVEPRPSGQTNVTSTGAGTIDEPTVDEQHMSAITPVRDVARLQITQGNDAGQELEIRPGKTYTIGRAVDNDVVLTDIAVSRKHFDLRFEDGAWVIVDRGSGNGTVVNGNLEDNPFMLANGDMIEIGNTVFRFDQPNAAARPQRTIDIDEEELSTVAGKPLRTELPDPAPPLAAAPRPMRAKTLPPPTPLRASTQPPPPSYASSAAAVPLPASTLPPAQLGNRAPLPGIAPAMLGDGLAVPASARHGAGLPGVGMPSGGMPTNGGPTNGMATNQLANAGPMATGSAQRAIYTYPQATEIPPHSVHAQMLLIQTQNRRGDGSTALVSPTPFDMLPPQAPRYMPPQLSKRAKLVLAGIGLAVVAGVLTVAIAKSGDSKPKPVAADKQGAATPAKVAATSDEPTLTADGTKQAPGTSAPTVAKVTVATIDMTEPTPTVARTELKASDTEPTPAVAKPEPAKPELAKPEPAKPEPKKVQKAVAKSEPKSPRKTPERREPPERRETRREPAPAPKRVATVDTDDAKSRAESLYRAKKFGEASSVLAAAAKKADDGDARELRRTADTYAKLGRALSQGTAPATKSTDAFEALRQAQAYDRNLGSAFDDEIQTKLAQVAPKAALSYMAAKNYPSARSAVIAAQQFGASESVKLVSQKLESVAGELYNTGMRELANNPSSAKEKFRQIKTIVDAKSTWYQKAQKQLQGG